MKNTKNVYETFVLIMQFGINMIVPIFLCTLFGVWLASKTGWKILVVLFFLAGALAGMRNCYIVVRRIIEREKKSRGSQETASEIISEARKGRNK